MSSSIRSDDNEGVLPNTVQLALNSLINLQKNASPIVVLKGFRDLAQSISKVPKTLMKDHPGIPWKQLRVLDCVLVLNSSYDTCSIPTRLYNEHDQAMKLEFIRRIRQTDLQELKTSFNLINELPGIFKQNTSRALYTRLIVDYYNDEHNLNLIHSSSRALWLIKDSVFEEWSNAISTLNAAILRHLFVLGESFIQLGKSKLTLPKLREYFIDQLDKSDPTVRSKYFEHPGICFDSLINEKLLPCLFALRFFPNNEDISKRYKNRLRYSQDVTMLQAIINVQSNPHIKKFAELATEKLQRLSKHPAHTSTSSASAPIQSNKVQNSSQNSYLQFFREFFSKALDQVHLYQKVIKVINDKSDQVHLYEVIKMINDKSIQVHLYENVIKAINDRSDIEIALLLIDTRTRLDPARELWTIIAGSFIKCV